MARSAHRRYLSVIASTAVLAAAAPSNAAPAAPVAPAADTPLAIAAAAPDLKWAECPAIFPSGCAIAVLHGSPAEPAADVFLRVPPGYVIPAHSHTSAERMVLVSGQLDVTYAGHPTARLQRGDYAYGPAALPHVARCNGAEACILFIAFNGAVDALAFDGTIVETSH